MWIYRFTVKNAARARQYEADCMAIPVQLEDHTGNVLKVKLDETATADRLVRAMISRLKLPLVNEELDERM